MQLEIISPDKSLYQGDVTLVQFPGQEGSFEILPSHAPMIAALQAGTIRFIETDNSSKTFDIKGGVVEVLKDKVLVLVD